MPRAIIAGVLLGALPLGATSLNAAPAPQVKLAQGNGIGDFYNARNGAPLWFSASAGHGAQALIDLLKSAKTDGLEPDRYGVASLEDALREASGGKFKAVSRADAMLSQAFAAYVSDLRQSPDLGIIYVDPQLRPSTPSARAILEQAAAAPS